MHGDSINTHSQRTERKDVERKDVRSGKAADGVWMMDDGGLTGVLHIKSIGFCFFFNHTFTQPPGCRMLQL